MGIFRGFKNIPFDCRFVVESPSGTSDDRFLSAAAPWVAGDVKVDIDGDGGTNIGTLPTRVGSTALYELSLTATEMAGSCISVLLIDADGPAWRDAIIQIRTDLWEGVLDSGVAQDGDDDEITLAATASASDNLYKDAIVAIIGGTGAGQSRGITGYNGTSKVASVGRNWVTNPDSTSQYVIFAGQEQFYMLEGTEPTGAPDADSSFRAIMQAVKRRKFNKVDQTATEQTVYKDDGTTECHTSTCSNDGTTMIKGAASDA